MTLKEILNTIKEKKAEANIDLDAVEPKFRGGVEGTIRAAKVSVDQLTEQYKQEVTKHLVLVAVNGPGAEQFANLAKSFKTLAIDFRGLAKSLAQRIRERNGQLVYTQHEHYLLLAELASVKAKYGIASLPAPSYSFNDGAFGQTLEQAVDKVLTNNYNNTLYSLVVRKDLGLTALDAEFTGKTLAVVLYNCDSVDSTYLPLPSEIVTAGESVDTDEVKKILSSVKNKLKKTKVSEVEQEQEASDDQEASDI